MRRAPKDDRQDKLPELVKGVKVGTVLTVLGEQVASHGRHARDTPAAKRERLGPMGDVFALLPSETKGIWDRKSKALTAQRRHEAFRKELDGASTSKDELAKFAESVVEKYGGAKPSPEQRTLVLEQLKKKSLWKEAVAFYERSTALSPAYASYPLPAEHYLVALNKSGELAKSVSVAKSMLSELSKNGRLSLDDLGVAALDRSPFVNGETLGALGSAFRSIHDIAYGAKVLGEAKEAEQALAAAKSNPKRAKELPKLEGRSAFLGELYRAVTGKKSLEDAVSLGEEHKELIRTELGLVKTSLPRDFDYSKAALEISTRYYDAGYAADFEYYPGINAMYNHHSLGHVSELKLLEPLVAHSLQQAGGAKSKDYWALATQLEFGLLAKNDEVVKQLLPLVLGAAAADWEVGTTAKQIVKLIDQRERAGADTTLPRFVYLLMVGLRDGREKMPLTTARISEISAELHELSGQASSPKAADFAANDVKHADLWAAVTDRSTHFGEMSNHYRGMVLRGNIKYGGLIPDIKVGRPDVAMAREVLSRLGLAESVDSDLWNAKVDEYLGKQLHLETPSGRRPLEDLHSKEHHFMEAVRRSLVELTGIKDPDSGQVRESKTSLMTSVALGCVDCRETAFAKQLLYDVWKKGNQNRLKREAQAAFGKGDEGTFRDRMKAVARLDREQLVTFSVMVKAPIEMKELYKPVLSPEGARVRDQKVADAQKDEFRDVENHTFNAMVRRNDDGSLGLEWRDAFYQQLYQWSRLPVVPEQIFEKSGFVAGTMTPLDHLGNKIPVQAVLVPYSKGTIDELSGEHGGETHFFGLEAARPSPNHLHDPESMAPFLQRMAQNAPA